MKKLIFAILSMTICVFLLAGCDDALSDNDALESTHISFDTEEKSTDDAEISNTIEDSSETTEVYDNNCEEMKNANGYRYTVSFVGWAGDSDLTELSQGQTGRYPVVKIDTLEELDQFKSKWGNIFDFSRGYDEVLSFEDTMEKTKWDTEAFYKEHSLLVIYVESGSGTYRFGVKEIAVTDNSMSIDVEPLNNPEVISHDMVGWFVLIEITDEEAQKYTSFITD